MTSSISARNLADSPMETLSPVAILVSVLALGCADPVPLQDASTDLFQLVELQGSAGVIVPPTYACTEWVDGRFYGKPIDGFWLVTPEDVRLAYARARIDLGDLQSVMQRGLVRNLVHPSQDLTFILDHFGTFDSQYLGFVDQGRRRVMCNFFAADDARQDDLWRREWITVDGGGPAYWTIEYDVDEDRCYKFWPNAPM
jgi:hypothetical protein